MGIDNGELWETHQVLKPSMLTFVRERLAFQAERRDEPKANVRHFSRALSLDVLALGLHLALRPASE